MLAAVPALGATPPSATRREVAARAPEPARPAATPDPTQTPSATSAPAPAPALATSESSAKIKDLERRVVQLREQVFRSKARLNLLRETVMHGAIGTSKAVIRHENTMGSSFKLVRVAYAIDGQMLLSRYDDSGELDDTKQFEVFSGAIVPGSHTVTAVLQFVGNDYGALSYMKGYKYTVRASHTFIAGESRTSQVTVVAFERGGMTTAFKDKPAIEFKVRSEAEHAPAASPAPRR